MRTSDILDAKIGSSQVSAIYLGYAPVWYRPNPSAEAEVSNWLSLIDYARSISGGTNFLRPSQTVINATTIFLSGLHNSGMRSKFLRLNLFNGGDWAASFIPLIRDAGNSIWDYNGASGATASQLLSGPFTSSMWSLSGGFDASAVNSTIVGRSSLGAYLDTGISTSSAAFLTAFQNYSLHASCYVNTLGSKFGSAADLTEVGYYGGDSAVLFLRANYKPYYLNASNSTSQRGTPGFYTYNGFTASGNSNALVYTAANTSFDPRGLSIGTRVSATSTTFYKNSSIPTAYTSGTQTFANPNSTPPVIISPTPNSTIAIFCDSAPGGLGVAKNSISYSDRAISMYSIGTGLSSSDAATLNTLVASFNLSIGRSTF